MATTKSLLNEVLPEYDISAIHSIRIHASPEKIYQVLQKGFPQGKATRFLMALRSIPRLFRNACQVDGSSFYRLKESKNQEIVLGIAGQFWKPVAVLVPIQSLEDFVTFKRKDHCKAAINLLISPAEPGSSLVSTETRVAAFGSAKQKFARYWRLIAPFSGLIRLEALRKIKKCAECDSSE